jgi:hypothetical protein
VVEPEQLAPVTTRLDVGADRVLLLAYSFFTVAAGARSGVQLATRFDQAPLAYGLSALAAVVYAAGAVVFALVGRTPRLRLWVIRLCTLELAGVVVIGASSVAFPAAYPDATVWSGFGSGYAFVPLALPVLGLLWARRSSPASPVSRVRRPG